MFFLLWVQGLGLGFRVLGSSGAWDLIYGFGASTIPIVLPLRVLIRSVPVRIPTPIFKMINKTTNSEPSFSRNVMRSRGKGRPSPGRSEHSEGSCGKL